MFKLIAVFLLLFASKSVMSSDISPAVIQMQKHEFKSLYYKMMVETYQLSDDSALAGMGGTPVPYILIYDVLKQKFVSDAAKYKLLRLGEIDDGAVLNMPTILSNKPIYHHYFNSLELVQLKKYLPNVDTNNEYIVIMAIPTIKDARDTESLIKQTGMKNYVSLPKLVTHINKELKNKNWQIFKYTSG